MKTDYVFFWHGDRGENKEYGQWYMRDMKMDLISISSSLPFLAHWINDNRPTVITVNCCEQWMMFCKAVLMGDNIMANHILHLALPKAQKAAGREIQNFDEALWVQWREEIVFQGNWVKFTQHKDLNKKITSVPAGEIFVEASPLDKIWGIGREEKDPKAWDEKTWNGLNLLGKAITKVHTRLLGGV